MAEAVHDVLGTFLPRLPPASIAGGKHLKELGADSVDRVEIILTLIGRLAIEEPLSSFSDLPDVNALVDFLAARTGG